MKRKLLGLGAALVAVAAGFGIWQGQMEVQANRGDHPEYVVDPSWPRALPHQWLIGQVPGIAVDRDDNIWIVQRPRTLTSDERAASDTEPGTPPALDGAPRPQGALADCCLPAPSVMQFDPKGRLLRAWGGPADPEFGVGGPGSKCAEPGCQWPNTEHGIYVDHRMNVWLGGQAGGAVLKFTKDGDFLLQIGRRQPPVRNSNDTNGGINGTPLLAQPADMEVDSADQRALHRRRVHQPARDRGRRRNRHVQAPLGRLRPEPGRRHAGRARRGRSTSRTRRRRRTSATRCTRCASPTMGWSMSPTA